MSTQPWLDELPPTAAWRHIDAHDGFEVLFARADGAGVRLDGDIAVVEEGVPCGVRYSLHIDRDWTVLSAHVIARSADGEAERRIDRAFDGSLAIDGDEAPQFAGLVDVDLEGSAVTNALPVNRMRPSVGERIDAPAAYVRLPDLRVERLDQAYRRLDDDADRMRYEYEAPAFNTRCVIVYDEAGLVLDYPGLAVRVS